MFAKRRNQQSHLIFQVSSIEDTISVIRSHEGVHVAYPVSLPPLSALQLDGSETLFTAISKLRMFDIIKINNLIVFYSIFL